MYILYRIGYNSKFVLLNNFIMVENSFGSNFCLELPSVKDDEGARPTYKRIAVNRPRGAIPIKVWHLSRYNEYGESKIKDKSTVKEFKPCLIINLEPLGDEGR